MECLSIETFSTIAGSLESIATVIAIAIGGIWTYFLFIKNRSDYPAIETEIFVKQFQLGQGKRLLHTKVLIKNTSSILLRSYFAELRLRQVTPVPENIMRDAIEGYDPIPEGRQQIEWPLIAGRKWHWNENECDIEPKETDALYADFIVDEELDVVEFYFYLENHKKQQHKLGWAETKLLSLNEKE